MVSTRMTLRKASIASRTFIVAAAFALALGFALAAMPGQAHAISVRQTDVATASEGCVLLGVDGTFSSAGKEAALARINKIRKEACDKGYPDPENENRALTPADYVPIKWSSSLEEIAQTRAAEATLVEDHVRPNGKSCFTAYANREVRSYGEVLAWNYSGMLDGIDQWYGEKSDWVNHNSGAVTGHYTSMINPANTHVGLGTFGLGKGGWLCTAGEFYSANDDEAVAEDEVGVKGRYRQVVEVSQESVQGVSVSGKSKIDGKGTAKYAFAVNAQFDGVFGASTVGMVPLDEPTWASSDTSVLTVDASGKASAIRCGRAVVSASAFGRKASISVQVAPAVPAISKVVPNKKKALKVTWSKNAAFAQGYQISYATKASSLMKGAKTATVKGAGKGSRVIKKLKAKTTYYVKVRSYAKVAGTTYYSHWSAKKSAKTK